MTPCPSKLSHAIGFDEFPFQRSHYGDVRIVGAVYAATRLEGILSGVIRRDGANSAKNVAELVRNSKFYEHTQLILFQGIALGGFNVLDIHWLADTLERPVLVVARKQPNMDSIREALLTRVRGGKGKWALIEKAGEMEPVGSVWVQRAGLTILQAAQSLEKFCVHSSIPEPLRTAHLIAGGIATGQSRARP